MQTGHRCEACREHFRSARARDRFCPSCRAIIEREREELESLLSIASESPNQDIQEESTAEFHRSLACPVCAWEENRNRLFPRKPALLSTYANNFAMRGLKHRIHHAFPGRFMVSRRFTSKRMREEIEAERAFNKEWDKRIALWQET